MRTTTIVVAILIALTSIASANTHQEEAKKLAASVSIAAQHSSVTPKVFREAERLIVERGFRKNGMWSASVQGFFVHSHGIYNILITWDGKILCFTKNAFGNILDSDIIGSWE